MKIFDCFTYCDEDLILNLRLNILKDYVDYFVIVESKFKHNGDVKNKNFNLDKYKKFKNKIIYIYIENEPKNIQKIQVDDEKGNLRSKLVHNTYLRENYQRNCIEKGLTNANDNDFIIVSDVDEIPNLENVDFTKKKNSIFIFKQKMFYYKLNLLYEDFTWYGAKACKKSKLISPQWLRNTKNKKYSRFRLDLLFSNKKYSNIKFIEDGGWHFTNIKKPKEIFEKLNSFLHHVDFKESNLTYEKFKEFFNDKRVFYDHSASSKKINRWHSDKKLKKIDLKKLPNFLKKNQNEYKDWIE